MESAATLLAAVEGSDLLADPAAPTAVNVRALRREYDRFVRLPRTLVEDVARTTVLAQKAWTSARGAADFLTRSTAILATLFVVCCIALATIASLNNRTAKVDASAAAPAQTAVTASPASGGRSVGGSAKSTCCPARSGR